MGSGIKSRIMQGKKSREMPILQGLHKGIERKCRNNVHNIQRQRKGLRTLILGHWPGHGDKNGKEHMI